MDTSQQQMHAAGHARISPTNVLLNEAELDTIENALLSYGQGLKHDDFRERESTSTALKKINSIRKAACCKVVKIEPV